MSLKSRAAEKAFSPFLLTTERVFFNSLAAGGGNGKSLGVGTTFAARISLAMLMVPSRDSVSRGQGRCSEVAVASNEFSNKPVALEKIFLALVLPWPGLEAQVTAPLAGADLQEGFA